MAKKIICWTKPCFTELLWFDTAKILEISDYLKEFGFRISQIVDRNYENRNYILIDTKNYYRNIIKDGDYIALIFNPIFPTAVDDIKVFAKEQIDEYFEKT